MIFDIKPISMSVGQVDKDSQPIQLNRYANYVDDLTQTWNIFSLNSSYRFAEISRSNPLLITFKLPQQCLGVPSIIQSLGLTLQYYYGGNTITQLQCILLPFVAKRINSDIANNRSIGIHINRINNLIQNNTLEYGYASISSGLRQVFFDGSVSPTSSNKFIGMDDNNIWMPLSTEILHSYINSVSTPLFTFAVFPNIDDTTNPIYILEPANADTELLATLRIQTPVDNNFINQITNNKVLPISYAPSIITKEIEIGKFKYSMGVAIPHRDGYSPSTGLYGNISRTDNVGKYMEHCANVAPEFIVGHGSDYNYIYNGGFQADRGNEITLFPLYGDTDTAGPFDDALPVPGWLPRNSNTSLGIVDLDSTDIYTPPLPNSLSSNFLQKAMLVESYDSTNTTSPWKRRIYGIEPSNSYYQYGCVGQQVGQLEDDEEYILEAWVRPYFGAQYSNGSYINYNNANARVKIRMSFLSGFIHAANPNDGAYITFSTGQNFDCSDDASIPLGITALAQRNGSVWQRLWLKIRLPKFNSIQRLVSRFDSTTDPKGNDALLSDPNFYDLNGSLVERITSFGEVRFDVIPYNNNLSPTHRFDTKFLISNVTLIKSNNRDYIASSLPIGKNKPPFYDRKRGISGVENIMDEPACFYMPLRGSVVNAKNTALYGVHSQTWHVDGATTQDTSWLSSNRFVFVDRISPFSTNYGGLAANPRGEYLYQFFTTKSNGKYGHGSHIIARIENTCLVNPNQGCIEFLYCPTFFSKIDGLGNTIVHNNVRVEGVQKFYGANSRFKPYNTDQYGDYCEYNQSFAPLFYTISLGAPKHILSITYSPQGFTADPILAKTFNGQIYASTGVSFFRQGRMIYCLIYEPGDSQHIWNNVVPLIYQDSARKQQKYVLLKYMIPESLYRAMSDLSSVKTIPSWFYIKLSWGARQELYVNGELVDYQNMSGLFQNISRMVNENTKVFNNIPNTLWLGTIGLLSESPNAWENKPTIYSDNMILRDILISSSSKQQTHIASTVPGYEISWCGLENRYTISNSTIMDLTNV